MIHLTLNTGHSRESPRAEVGDDTIRLLRPLIHEPALLAPEALEWLGDAERCVAWTIIEEDRRVQ